MSERWVGERKHGDGMLDTGESGWSDERSTACI